MTTPLGTLDVLEREGRRVRSRAARARPISASSLDLDGTGQPTSTTGVGFYDHLLGSLAHHGLFDLESRRPATCTSTSITPSRTWPS